MTADLAPLSQDRSPFSWFRKLARASVPEAWGVYEYSVFSASTANGIEAMSTDPTQPVPSVVAVPIRPGIGGAKTVPAPGSLCYVAFANGDRTKPVVISYDSTTAPSLQLDALIVKLGHAPTMGIVLGPPLATQLADLVTFLGLLQTYVNAIQGIADPSHTATPPLVAGIAALETALGLPNASTTCKASP